MAMGRVFSTDLRQLVSITNGDLELIHEAENDQPLDDENLEVYIQQWMLTSKS